MGEKEEKKIELGILGKEGFLCFALFSVSNHAKCLRFVKN